MSKPREVAFWAGVSAFFGNLVGLKVLELISGNNWIQVLSGILVSAVVGLTVYSKERLQAARDRQNGGGAQPKEGS